MLYVSTTHKDFSQPEKLQQPLCGISSATRHNKVKRKGTCLVLLVPQRSPYPMLDPTITTTRICTSGARDWRKQKSKNILQGSVEKSPCTKVAMKLNPLDKNALNKGKAIILEELAPKPWQEVARPQVEEEKLVGGLGGAAERAWMRKHTFI